MLEDNSRRQVVEVMLKMVMLQRLKTCFIKVLMKRQVLEAELMEIERRIKSGAKKESEDIRRFEYLCKKVESFKNQERRLYQKIKWIEEKMQSYK